MFTPFTNPEQAKFLKMPEFLYSYKTLNANAREIYMICLRRYNLSTKNDLQDIDGNIYIVYPVDDIIKFTGTKRHSVRKALKALIDCKLIITKKGKGNANLIYLPQPDNFTDAYKIKPKYSMSNNKKFENCEDTLDDIITPSHVTKNNATNKSLAKNNTHADNEKFLNSNKDEFIKPTNDNQISEMRNSNTRSMNNEFPEVRNSNLSYKDNLNNICNKSSQSSQLIDLTDKNFINQIYNHDLKNQSAKINSCGNNLDGSNSFAENNKTLQKISGYTPSRQTNKPLKIQPNGFVSHNKKFSSSQREELFKAVVASYQNSGNIDLNNKQHDSYSNKLDQNDDIIKIDNLRERIKSNIGYEYFKTSKTFMYSDLPLVDELIENMIDVLFSTGNTVRINSENKSLAVVQSVYYKLEHRHIKYCVERFNTVKEQIINKKAYLRTMLYNSSLEAASYEQNNENINDVA